MFGPGAFVDLAVNAGNSIKAGKFEIIKICVPEVVASFTYCNCFQVFWGIEEKVADIIMYSSWIDGITNEIKGDKLVIEIDVKFELIYRGEDGELYVFHRQNKFTGRVENHSRKSAVKLNVNQFNSAYHLLDPCTLKGEVYVAVKGVFVDPQIVCLSLSVTEC